MVDIDMLTQKIAEVEALVIQFGNIVVTNGVSAIVEGYEKDDAERKSLGREMIFFGGIIEQNSYIIAMVVCFFLDDDLMELYAATLTEGDT